MIVCHLVLRVVRILFRPHDFLFERKMRGNVLFFSGASQATLLRLFPPPAYHLPDNPLFELTGILQIAGLWAAWMSWRILRTWRRAA